MKNKALYPPDSLITSTQRIWEIELQGTAQAVDDAVAAIAENQQEVVLKITLSGQPGDGLHAQLRLHLKDAVMITLVQQILEHDHPLVKIKKNQEVQNVGTF